MRILLLLVIAALLSGCAATNFSEDIKFKPYQGRPGVIYNPEFENGFTPDGAPRPNLNKGSK